ncbi:ABC transporter ATP-binding protein [Fusibacter sp. JL298sf-3]
MTKLIRFLKPFVFYLIVAVVLLYGQAMADLALPDYMSKIVNTGIQQSGYESAVLDVLKAEDYAVFRQVAGDRASALDAYEKDGDYYVLGGIDAEQKTELEAVTVDFLIASAKQMGLPIETEGLTDDMRTQVAIGMVKGYNESLGEDVEGQQMRYILKVGGQMILIALVGAVASIAVGLIAARVASGVGRNLRQAVFEKVAQFSSFEMDHFSSASLITRTTNDITQIQTLLVMMIRMLFYAPIIGVGGAIRALDKSPSMSWIIALAVIVLMGVIAVVFVIALPKFKAVQRLVDRLNGVVREQLSGMMVVRAFNTQGYESNRFDKANSDLTKTNLFVNRVMVVLFPLMMLIMNGVTLLIIWVGAHQIEASALQVGDMMAFMQYALQIIFAFLMMSMMFIMVPRASVSALRVAEVLDREVLIKDPEKPVQPKADGVGKVVFDNVTFKYPGAEEPVLKALSFTCEPGQMTAIIGSTGAGKSTLLNLVPRFYDVTDGAITIDGVDVRAMTQHDLRTLIGYVPQKSVLFSGTIESNLTFGGATVEPAAMNTAIDIAQAREIVEEKEEKLAAPIAQGGGNVSGGQKQRLSIARALAKQPKILVLDDSFSALDFKTDARLRAQLLEKAGDTTLLLVAQRVSTIRNADQILVLDEGRLVGRGTHDELIETCEPYREIAVSQLGEEAI